MLGAEDSSAFAVLFAINWPVLELKKIRFQFHDDSIYKELHINVQTPRSLKRRLSKYGFEGRIICADPSRNLLSLVFKRWAGRTIDAVASPK